VMTVAFICWSFLLVFVFDVPEFSENSESCRENFFG
jgi:hypothetical protein